MRANPRRYALAAAAAIAVVVLAIAIAAPSTQSPAPTATPSLATPSGAPRVIFTRQVVLGGVPGGGLVMGPAFDAFVILSAGRPPESHHVVGDGIGTPVFDGRDRIAYWRSAGFTSSSGMSGPYEVVVWDLRADRERVLLTLKDERSSGELLWSADLKSLVVPTRAVAATGGGAQTRLLLIDADSGTMRVLHTACRRRGDRSALR
jgi:hypothetical protein